MSLAITSIGPSALELEVEGKLDKDDYEKFGRLAEARIKEHGKIALLVHVAKLRGWTPAALWADLKFDVKHYNDVSRLALVGEDPFDKRWMASLAKPFTSAEVAFYPESELEAGRNWVLGKGDKH